MAGKIQDADIKSEAELVAKGATRAQLPSAEKIYSPKTEETLEERLPEDAGVLASDATAEAYAITYALIFG